MTAGQALRKEHALAVTNQLAALLVAGDPRGAADRTLAFLVSLNKARGAAVFALDGDRLTLFTGRGSDVEAVTTVQGAWANHRAKLQSGQVLRDTDGRASYVVAPLSDGGTVVALLYLDFCARSPAECRLKDAEKAARRALSLKPDFREARNTLGVVLIHQQRPRDAIAVLKPLSEDILYGTPEKAWGNLGWAYFEAGDVDRSIDALRRSIAAQTLFCVGSFRLGLAYERRAEFASALAAFSRALETNAPECAQLQDAWWGRARVAERLGQTDSIRADLERCVELSSSTGTGKNCRSMLDKLK